eukprot:jgi/Phyca11/106021/e_gw1.11.352.1
MTVSPFARQSSSRVKTQAPLEVIHSDVMGPMRTRTKGGARFVVTFVDDFSRYVHVYLLKSKAEVFQHFVRFKQLAETQ